MTAKKKSKSVFDKSLRREPVREKRGRGRTSEAPEACLQARRGAERGGRSQRFSQPGAAEGIYQAGSKRTPDWTKLLTAEAGSELKQVGAFLSVARTRRGMSVSELATRMGIDRRTLTQLEKGSPTVSLGVFFQALSVLNLLRGIEEIVRPENDVEAMSTSLRRIRKQLPPIKAISDKKVEF